MANVEPQALEIGQRVRAIRQRRGLGLNEAAGLAGISKPYLSLLERGQRRFERRGLLEDLANALGCSVSDLTGQPYVPVDRDSADALATLPAISVALHDASLDDAPDMPTRSVDELARLASQANEHAANVRYSLAGRDLGALLLELHVLAVTGDTDTQRAATAALAEACFVAAGAARTLGNLDLAVLAARRGEDAARRLDSPALNAFAAMTASSSLSRLGARHRASQVVANALGDVERHADPSAPDTAAAESAGMLHLSSAQMSAKAHRLDDAEAHLSAARELGEWTGEQNTLWFSFGPANVRAWSLSVAVELGNGPAAAERIEATPGYAEGLATADRRSALHFDMARAYAQAKGDRDTAAIRHLDTADRIAAQRIRNDPVARELVAELDRRTRRRSWELQSLKNRLGVG